MKQIQKLVVGRTSEEGAFIPCAKQPVKPITDLNKMITWAKAELDERPGVYKLMREIPGILIVETVQKLNISFEGD